MALKSNQTAQELQITNHSETISEGRMFQDDTELLEESSLTKEERAVGNKEVVFFRHPSGLFGMRFFKGGAFPEALDGAYTSLKFAEQAFIEYKATLKAK